MEERLFIGMECLLFKEAFFNLIKEVPRFRLSGLEAGDFLVSVGVQTPTEKLR